MKDNLLEIPKIEFYKNVLSNIYKAEINYKIEHDNIISFSFNFNNFNIKKDIRKDIILNTNFDYTIKEIMKDIDFSIASMYKKI